MHRKHRKARIRGLMGRAWDAVIRRLTDTERRRYDMFCAAAEVELAARERWHGYGY